VSISLYWYAHKYKKIEYIFPSFALCACRNIIRMFDIEDSESYLTDVEYNNLIMMQALGSSVFVTVFIVYFQSVNRFRIWIAVYLTTWNSAFMTGLLKMNLYREYQERYKLVFINSAFFFCAFFISINIMMNHG
jgi:hypothetical protein